MNVTNLNDIYNLRNASNLDLC